MQFSDMLEIAIGLTFIFLLMSLLLTAFKESWESIAKVRGVRLLEGVAELLGDPATPRVGHTAAEALYKHPLIQGLYRRSFAEAKASRQLPSYIPSRNFALALVDQVLAFELDAAVTDASLPPVASRIEQLRFAAERIENDALRRAMLQAVEVGAGDLDRVHSHLAAWYDSGMDRVSGGYRRRAQTILFWSGLAAAILLNVNAFTIAHTLSQSSTLRRVVAASAERHVAEAAAAAEASAAEPRATEAPETPPPPDANTTVTNATDAAETNTAAAAAPSAPRSFITAEDKQADKEFGMAVERIRELGLPIGWGKTTWEAMEALYGPLSWSNLVAWLPVLAGWAATALAMTLGAPFWFDILNRLMVVRATVKPHEKSPEEGSQDTPDQERKGTAKIFLSAAKTRTPPRGSQRPTFEDCDPVVDKISPQDRPREEDEFDLAAVAAVAAGGAP